VFPRKDEHSFSDRLKCAKRAVRAGSIAKWALLIAVFFHFHEVPAPPWGSATSVASLWIAVAACLVLLICVPLVAIRCPACGKQLSCLATDPRFCSQCGSSLHSGTPGDSHGDR